MFITRIGDQRCCTCNHWQGVRVTENDGYIYSLKDVEGICHNLQPSPAGHSACMSLTLPAALCQQWEKWDGLSFPEGKAAATRYGAAVAGFI